MVVLFCFVFPSAGLTTGEKESCGWGGGLVGKRFRASLDGREDLGKWVSGREEIHARKGKLSWMMMLGPDSGRP